jgi:hypothetical protein
VKRYRHRAGGLVLSSEIEGAYSDICTEANVAERKIDDVLKELGIFCGGKKAKSRPKQVKADGSVSQKTAYRIPRPKAAKVVSIDRRQAS